jgi:hypothetical protein
LFKKTNPDLEKLIVLEKYSIVLKKTLIVLQGVHIDSYICRFETIISIPTDVSFSKFSV